MEDEVRSKFLRGLSTRFLLVTLVLIHPFIAGCNVAEESKSVRTSETTETTERVQTIETTQQAEEAQVFRAADESECYNAFTKQQGGKKCY